MNMLSKVLVPVALAAMLGSCSAYDLGDEKPQHIAVDTDAPTWDNGIGNLVKAKCANCHTAARSKFVPGNVPAILDGIGDESFFANPDSKHLAAHAYNRVYMDKHTPMPPKFGTPLLDDERAAFSKYLEGLGVGADAQCPRKETTLTYAEAQPLIAASCAYAGCHAASSVSIRLPLDTLAQNKALRYNSIAYLSTGFMPYGDSAFIKSDNGKKLLDWFCNGAELQ